MFDKGLNPALGPLSVGLLIVATFATLAPEARADEDQPTVISLTLAPGFASLTGHRAEAGSSGLGLTIDGTLHLSERLALSFDGSLSTGFSYAPDDRQSQSTSLLLAGFQWNPLSSIYGPRERFDPKALYVRLGAGYAELNRHSGNNAVTIARGFAAAVTVGWLPLQGHDWSLGLLFSETPIFYNNDEGLRHNIYTLVAVEILWNPRS